MAEGHYGVSVGSSKIPGKMANMGVVRCRTTGRTCVVWGCSCVGIILPPQTSSLLNFACLAPLHLITNTLGVAVGIVEGILVGF